MINFIIIHRSNILNKDSNKLNSSKKMDSSKNNRSFFKAKFDIKKISV